VFASNKMKTKSSCIALGMLKTRFTKNVHYKTHIPIGVIQRSLIPIVNRQSMLSSFSPVGGVNQKIGSGYIEHDIGVIPAFSEVFQDPVFDLLSVEFEEFVRQGPIVLVSPRQTSIYVMYPTAHDI